jgi:putative ABC transport system ATP-binding protein
VIELDQVWRSYQVGEQPLHALQDVSVVVPDGGYIAIMGPSGSGKSTLLNILGCLDRPSQGVYRLDGEDVGSLPEEEISEIRRHKIGFIFQSFHLVARLSAAENVALPMLLAGTSPEERAERVASALEAVGMSERAGHRPNALSGGERQRVAIARATVMRPKVLLADEPTGNLDSASGSQVMELLEGMNASGLTFVVVTHDPGIGQRADRVLLLRDGRLDREIAGSELGGGLGILASSTSS